MPVELPVLTVPSSVAWSQWLVNEAESSTGVWLTLAKKGVSEPTSLTYAQALDEALCHGWIDGQTRSCDDKTYLHRFTPRTKTSSWSKRNVGHVARLEEEGRMYPRGTMEVERAKQDGRWDAAYAGQATMEPSAELSAAIAKDAEAQAVWDRLTKQNQYAFCYRLAALKTDAGKQKRIIATVEALRRGDLPYPQKQFSAQKGRKGTPAVELTKVDKRAKVNKPAKVGKATRRSIRSRTEDKP